MKKFSENRENIVKKSRKRNFTLGEKVFISLLVSIVFSHYVTIFFLLITNFTLFFEDWRGYLIAGFSLVWIANIYMSLFGLLRQNLKAEKIEAKLKILSITI